MQITKREFLKRLGLGGAALAGGAALGDEAVKTKSARRAPCRPAAAAIRTTSGSARTSSRSSTR